jgi:hypothetical protein
LFLAANVLLTIGIAIGWGTLGHGAPNAYIPIAICNGLGIICIGLFYYFDAKEIYLIRQHVNVKYFRYYFIAGFIFVANVIFISIYSASIDSIKRTFDTEHAINATLGILFGVSSLVSLISIGVYRYARFKIDLALAKRRHGESIKEEPTANTPTAIDSNVDQK